MPHYIDTVWHTTAFRNLVVHHWIEKALIGCFIMFVRQAWDMVDLLILSPGPYRGSTKKNVHPLYELSCLWVWVWHPTDKILQVVILRLIGLKFPRLYQRKDMASFHPILDIVNAIPGGFVREAGGRGGFNRPLSLRYKCWIFGGEREAKKESYLNTISFCSPYPRFSVGTLLVPI